MEEKENIPKEVVKAFELLSGGEIRHLGIKDGVDYYLYKFPDEWETGFPQVVKYHSGKIEDINDFDAIKAIALFRGKD